MPGHGEFAGFSGCPHLPLTLPTYLVPAYTRLAPHVKMDIKIARGSEPPDERNRNATGRYMAKNSFLDQMRRNDSADCTVHTAHKKFE